MSGTVYPWSTPFEIDFIDHLGTWIDGRDLADVELADRLALLRHYRDTIFTRRWDRNMDTQALWNHVESVIAKLEVSEVRS